MDWRCDLYCFGDVTGGYTTYTAAYRRKGDIYPAPEMDISDFNQLNKEEQNAWANNWAKEYRKHMDSVEATELVPLELPHAGECFSDATPLEFYKRLVHLKSLGYIFPEEVFAEVEKEYEEELHKS